jgi:hypothetical protein
VRYHGYFEPAPGPSSLRIGLEFETGNIASSFRSLNKLNLLFRKDLLDAGVFITARDKQSTATRIWPVSNRNSSFEELERRNYQEMISFPIWEFAFAPDGVSPTAPYLGRDGATYQPIKTGRIETSADIAYEVWSGDGKQLLRRIAGEPPQPSM